MPTIGKNSVSGRDTPRLTIDLRCFWYPGFLALVFFAPLARGLFFPADLLPYQVIGAAVLTLAAFDALLRKETFRITPFYAGFLLLALSYGIATFFAAAKAQAVQGFLRYLMYAGVFWLSGYMAKEKRARMALLTTVFLSGCAVAGVGILSALHIFSFPAGADGARIMSTLQYPNALAAYMMFTSILGFTLWVLEERPLLRLLYSAGVYVQTLAFLSSFSRGGWVIYPFALLALFIGLDKTRRNAFLLMGISTLTAILLTLRQFVTALEGGAYVTARMYFLSGLGICILAEIGFLVYGAIRDRISLSDAARKVMSWAFGFYSSLILLVYSCMVLGQYGVQGMGPRGFLPASFIKRLSSISLEDQSLLTRAFATRDAIKIFLDNHFWGTGAGGWDALYHQYQSVLYWTTEVHNHAAQVLVEAGLFGFLSYGFIWAVLIRYVVTGLLKMKRFPQTRKRFRAKTRLIGLSVGVLSLGVHSLMDFELSLPGVFYQLIVVLGVIQVLVEGDDPKDFSSDGESTGQSRWKKAKNLIGVLMVFFTALLVGIPSYRFQRAGFYGSLGAQALFNHDFRRAEALYLIARGYDPYTASYSMDLAQTYGALSILEKRKDLGVKALSYLDQAAKMEPDAISHRVKEVEIRQSLADVEGAWNAAKRLPEIVPLDIRSYEIFGKSSVVSFMHSAKSAEGNADGRAQIMAEAAEKYLDPLLQVPERILALRNLIPKEYEKKWDPDKLDMSEALYLYVGQANLLSKHSIKAREFLEKAVKNPIYSREAGAWLEACDVYEGKVQNDDPAISSEARLILSHLSK